MVRTFMVCCVPSTSPQPLGMPMTAVGRPVNLARLPRHLQPTRWACVNSLFSAVCDRHRGGVAWVHVRRAVRERQCRACMEH